MKKWVFGIAVFLLLGWGAAHYYPMSNDIDLQVQPITPHQHGHAVQLTQEQIYKGNLLLVNHNYPVHGHEGTEVVRLIQHTELMQRVSLMDNAIRLSQDLIQPFADMMKDASGDGVNHFIISSGYRDNEEQQALYEQMGARLALPGGHSEHNLGLSLDIGSTQGEMRYAKEGKWLERHAWQYGFVLRYPEDKTAVTGIQFEPWHFRYVGFPHSAIMQEYNFVLEEYLDYLKEQEAISVTMDSGQVYEVFYYPLTEKTTIYVPANAHYEVSGNNMDGVIVTVMVNSGA